VQSGVVTALNVILQKADFRRPEDFQGPNTRCLVRSLLDSSGNPQSLQADQIIKINRLLLEETYPGAIQPAAAPRNWGWHDEHDGRTDPAKVPELIERASRARYEFALDRWQAFQRMLEDLAKRNVEVLGFVAPMHYGLAQAPAADDDGTGNAAYWALMSSLGELAVRHPNFHFIDLHRDGRNDFTDEEYVDWDHLNDKGAQRVTRLLVALQEKIDAQPKADVTPPAIAAVTAVGDPTRVEVVFSEPVRPAEAGNPAAYTVSGGVKVVTASLAADGRRLMLSTTPLAEGTSYSLTAANVADRFGNPLPAAPVSFTFVKSLVPGKPSRQDYVWDKLKSGSSAYVDQPSMVESAPPLCLGADFLRTADRDKGQGGDAFLSFQANYGVRVFVAHDEGIAMKPSWMDGFTYTWDFMRVSDVTNGVGRRHRLAYKDFPDGKVVLGGNSGPGGGMYLVLVQPRGAGQAGR
jgi:hypothetical protein